MIKDWAEQGQNSMMALIEVVILGTAAWHSGRSTTPSVSSRRSAHERLDVGGRGVGAARRIARGREVTRLLTVRRGSQDAVDGAGDLVKRCAAREPDARAEVDDT